MAGLFQGFTAGLANNSISMALGFVSYEGLCVGYTRWRGESPSTGTRGMLGGGAALLVTGATMPLENLVRVSACCRAEQPRSLHCLRLGPQKAAGSRAAAACSPPVPCPHPPPNTPTQVRRMQVQGREVGGAVAPRYTSTADCARQMLAHEGLRSFWRGT